MRKHLGAAQLEGFILGVASLIESDPLHQISGKDTHF
jgi:hypothetical protein